MRRRPHPNPGRRPPPHRRRHRRGHGRRRDHPRGRRGADRGRPYLRPHRTGRTPPRECPRHRRHRPPGHPRPRQHAWPRRDVAAARPRRRPSPHDLAERLHLPGRGRARGARLRLLGNPAVLGRDAEGRYYDFRRYVLLPRRHGPGHDRRRHPLGDRTARHRLPHPRLRHPRGLARRRGRVHGALPGPPHRGARRRGPRPLHHAAGGRRGRLPPGRAVRRPLPDPRGRGPFRRRDRPRTDRHGGGRGPRIDRGAQTRDGARPLDLPLGRGHSRALRPGAPASRTTPRAT